MKERDLAVILVGRHIGTLTDNEHHRLSFVYQSGWESLPLSFSMPLSTRAHGHEAAEAFVWGLLPDNAAVLGRWASQFQVSARNPFALIAHVGEDCAGAVQFAWPDRIAKLTSPSSRPRIHWLDEGDVAGILRTLREDNASGGRPRDTGQFSLAGAQPKTALLHADGRWGIPSGRVPTTHILKPPTADFDGYAENEHFCLVLARMAGLAAAQSSVMAFGDEKAIVVERYDRHAEPRDSRGRLSIQRIHQEDMCQALACLPIAKYQNEGGPSPEAIIALLRSHSRDAQDDVDRFVRALIFNWLIAGTDAHGKNYSVLHGGGGQVRLAPLYDVSSALPYDRLDPKAIKMAMKIGGVYRLRDIGPRNWRKFATANKLDVNYVLKVVSSMVQTMPNQAEAACRHLRNEGIVHPVIDRLVERLIARTALCRQELLIDGVNHEP